MTEIMFEPEDLTTLDGLTEIILPANTAWTFEAGWKPRGDFVSERFETGPYGMTRGELVGAIARIYARLARTRSTIEWEDEDGEKGECPFWGDHRFLEVLDIDDDKRVVSLHLGS